MSTIRVAGDTHVGKVREHNEDAMIVEHACGLYAVFDGMGGANAGDVAAQLARDAIRDYVMQERHTLEPKALLDAAIQHGSASVFKAGLVQRRHQGMGTTVVACLVIDPTRVVIGHVGDSRAYMLRGGRLTVLTRDHTIVEELVDRGLLAADQAEHHPYKNVLSRNLGARPETRVDVVEVEVRPGDRLMLCSDGLYGYASQEAIQYILGSGDAPEHVARDLIELALRGGGGDNVSTIVFEAPPAAATSTQVVRTSGAVAWWHRRERFLQIAKERGLTRNPICRGLGADEALDLIALSLCQAVFHDLEKSTGVNVWTFAQNLGGGWFERGGDWGAVRGMMDILTMSARAVIDEIRGGDPQLAFLLDVAVTRALVVAELALGGLLAERLRHVDGELLRLQQPPQRISEDGLDNTAERFTERLTIPFLSPERPVSNAGISAELLTAIGATITIAQARTSPRALLVKHILGALETISIDHGGNFATAVQAARELYGQRPVDDAGVMPLFDALEQARIITTSSVHQIEATVAIRARVLRAISTAHQRLVGATTGLVIEAALPHSEELQEAQARTSALRDEVQRIEIERAQLEKRFASKVDPSLPWGSRGSTEW